MLSRTTTISGGGECKAFTTRAGKRRARDTTDAPWCDERADVRRAGAPFAKGAMDICDDPHHDMRRKGETLKMVKC